MECKTLDTSVQLFLQVFADDPVILKSVFERHLLVNLVDSELFKPLVEFLTAHQKEADFLEPSVVVNELLQAKHTSEASTVDRACRGQQGKPLSHLQLSIE